MKIEDLLVVSDLDGTLVPAGGTISSKNLISISRFREKGGAFTVATGRSPTSARRFLEQLDIRTSIISNNGALVYDVGRSKPAWYQPLDPSFRQIIQDILTAYPEVAIEAINARDEYYLVSSNELLDGIITVQGFTACRCTPKELPDDCCKVLFVIRPDDFLRVTSGIRSQAYPHVDFVASGGDCFEMMAENINKGYPLEELAKAHGKTLAGTIAVGDYYNDLEMITRAGLGVAMGNAPKEVREAAKHVVSTCEEDGVAELLEWLAEHCEEL